MSVRRALALLNSPLLIHLGSLYIANNVDPDQTAFKREQSEQGLYCLLP